MKRRRSVTVFGRRYAIERVSQATLDRAWPDSEAGAVESDCHNHPPVICLVRGLSAEEEEKFIEHEVTHAVIYELGWRTKFGDEIEEIVAMQIVPAVRSAMGSR